jgi:hypothetical protein
MGDQKPEAEKDATPKGKPKRVDVKVSATQAAECAAGRFPGVVKEIVASNPGSSDNDVFSALSQFAQKGDLDRGGTITIKVTPSK